MQVKTKLITAGSIVLLSAIFLVFHLVYFRAPEREAGVERFVIAVSQNEFAAVVNRLKKEGFIRSITALNIPRGSGKNKWLCSWRRNFPGATKTSKSGSRRTLSKRLIISRVCISPIRI